MSLLSDTTRRAMQAHEAQPGPLPGASARTATRPAPLARWGRLLWLVATSVVLGLAATEFVVAFGVAEPFIDYAYYRDVGARWLADGTYYLPHQLADPHDVRLMVDVLYPPTALLLFVPFAFLPAVLWWAVPLGLIGYVVWTLRPAPWAVFVIACLLLWPRLQGAIIFGNTDMWVAAGVAAGLRWGWPAALIALKPTLLPLALVGVRHRSTWVAAAVLFVVSLPMLGDYVTAMLNVRASLDYSLGSIPFAVLPLVAWLGRQTGTRETHAERGITAVGAGEPDRKQIVGAVHRDVWADVLDARARRDSGA